MAICRCVSGIVVEEGSATPQGGLRVRLVTVKGRGSVALAEATTDKAGRFSIDISGLSADDTSGVYELKVFDGVVELYPDEPAVTAPPSPDPTDGDEPVVDPYVTDARGTALPGTSDDDATELARRWLDG